MLKKLKQNAISIICFSLAGILIITSFVATSLENSNKEKTKIALVLNASLGQNEVLMKQGAQLAAREANVNLNIFSPYSDIDVESYQIQCLKQIMAEGYKALAIIPAGGESLSRELKLVEKSGIHLICLDVPILGGNFSYVGTNHQQTGELLINSILKDSKKPLSIMIVKNYHGFDHINETVTDLRLRGIYKGFKQNYGTSSIRSMELVDRHSLLQTLENSKTQIIITMDSLLTDKLIALLPKENSPYKIYGFDSNQMHLKYFAQKLIEKELLRDSLAVGYKGIKTLLNKLNNKPYIKLEYLGPYLVDYILSLENRYAELIYPIINN